MKHNIKPQYAKVNKYARQYAKVNNSVVYVSAAYSQCEERTNEMILVQDFGSFHWYISDILSLLPKYRQHIAVVDPYIYKVFHKI